MVVPPKTFYLTDLLLAWERYFKYKVMKFHWHVSRVWIKNNSEEVQMPRTSLLMHVVRHEYLCIFEEFNWWFATRVAFQTVEWNLGNVRKACQENLSDGWRNASSKHVLLIVSQWCLFTRKIFQQLQACDTRSELGEGLQVCSSHLSIVISARKSKQQRTANLRLFENLIVEAFKIETSYTDIWFSIENGIQPPVILLPGKHTPRKLNWVKFENWSEILSKFEDFKVK